MLSVLEADADRSMRIAVPLLAALHTLEAVAHWGDRPHLAFTWPGLSAIALILLTIQQRRSEEPLSHATFWLLVPWAVSIGTCLIHVPTHPALPLPFITITLMAMAALLLPTLAFAIALPFAVLAQVYCLNAMPAANDASRIMVPLFSLAIAALINTSRRRALLAAETARRFEGELHRQKSEILKFEHERRRSRLESALVARSAELEASRRSLAEQQRLAALGTVAAGVAHQINNPIGAILAASDFALTSNEGPETSVLRRDALSDIREEAIRCGQIVRKLLRLSTAPAQQQSVPILDSVEAAIQRTDQETRQVGGQLTLTVRPGASQVLVRADETELEEVFVNLILNAAEAGGQGVQIEVEVRPSPDGVDVCVRDDGPGVDAADVEHLFEPFFTRRINQGGTGLGLSLAQRIIADCNGRIWLEAPNSSATPESASDEHGAAFHVWLPLDEKDEPRISQQET